MTPTYWYDDAGRKLIDHLPLTPEDQDIAQPLWGDAKTAVGFTLVTRSIRGVMSHEKADFLLMRTLTSMPDLPPAVKLALLDLSHLRA